VLNRLSTLYSGAPSLARFVPSVLVLCLIGCGGASSPSASIAPPLPEPTTGILRSFFGMQCGTGSTNCPDNGNNPPTPQWPTSVAQPGLLRLWDSQVSWSYLMAGPGNYNFAQLDGYLDDIAAHQPLVVNYVFGCVPSFIAPSGTSGTTPGSCGTNGSAAPPTDLTSSGSATFNEFVTTLINHCSPAGNCVKTLITGYELWNEANVSSGAAPRWTGTQTQLYQMVAPAVAIIKANVSDAKIFTPSITSGGGSWMTGWLNAEVAGGIISNRYNIHHYLNNELPEDSLSDVNSDLAPDAGTAGWTPVPWVMTETGYDDITIPYSCNSGNTGTQYSTPDCIGQMVRWDILLFAQSSSGLYWYYWNTYIGSDPQYATAYYSMMRSLLGGKFSAPCSSGGNATWTCSFTEANGTVAQWVWTTSEAGASYTVPSGYTDYWDLSGSSQPTTVTAGQTITIGVEPFMLEQ